MAVGDELMKARGVDPTSGSVSNTFDALSPIFQDYGIDPTTGTVRGVPRSSLSGKIFGGGEEKSQFSYWESGEEDPSGGFLGDTRERNAANNYGYIDRTMALEIALELASSPHVTGPLSLGGKMVGMAINGNNVYAVNAARAEMGLEPLTWKEALEGLVKDRQGVVAEIDINGKTYAVGLEAKTPNGRTTLTPTEARQRSLIAQNKVVEAPKGTFEKKEKEALRDPTITSQAGLGTRVKGAVQRGIDKVMGREPPKTGPQPVTVASPSFAAPAGVVERSLLGPVATPVDIPSVVPTPTIAPTPVAAPIEIPSVAPVVAPEITPSIAPATVSAPTTQAPQTAQVYQAPTIDTSRGIFSPEFSPPSTLSTPSSVTSVPEIQTPSLVAPEISTSFTPNFGTPTQIDGFEPFTVFEPGNSLGSMPAPANDIGTRDYGLSFYNPGQERVSQAVYNAGVGVANEMGRDLGITSGYRSPSHNERVGGANSSLHTHGRAMDVDLSGLSPAERQSLVEEFTQRGASGFITYTNSPNMLHVDFGARPAGDRGTIDRSKNPIEAPHFMHDRSQANMEKAPDWFQEAAKYGGLISLARTDVLPEARPDINANIPMASVAPQVEQRAPQNALNQGFMAYQVPEVPQFNPGTIGVQAPNQQLGPTTKDIYGWERPQEVLDLMALAISGELGSKTIAGIMSGNPEAVNQARQEIAAIASTIDNRAFSEQYANPADPRTSYTSVLDGAKYNSMMDRNMPTTRENYDLVGDFVTQALIDYDMGINPSPVPDATHYRSTDIEAPSWENTEGTQVGEHVFSSSMRADLSGYEYNPSKNADAFSSFSASLDDLESGIPDEAFSPIVSDGANQGFDTSPRDDKQALDSAMSFSLSPTAMAGTLGSGSLLDEPTTLEIDALTEFSPDLGTSAADKEAEDKESEKSEDSIEIGSVESEESYSTDYSGATGLLSDEGRSGSSGGYSQSEQDAADSGAGLF